MIIIITIVKPGSQAARQPGSQAARQPGSQAAKWQAARSQLTRCPDRPRRPVGRAGNIIIRILHYSCIIVYYSIVIIVYYSIL